MAVLALALAGLLHRFLPDWCRLAGHQWSWQAHLTDDPSFADLYVDRDLSSWTPPTRPVCARCRQTYNP